MTTTAWDRQRALLRVDVTTAAMALFATHGFDQTTIDDIVAAAGISRRSFFRYFGTKEDVVLGDLIQRGEAMASALEARPLDEEPWAALVAAMTNSQTERDDRESVLAIGRLIQGNPSLKAKSAEKHQRWSDLLVPLLVRHIQTPDAALTAAAIVATALACLDVASEAWVATDGSGDLAQLYLQTLAAVRG
jgi:AcrR family transcriptional regulator